MNLQTDPFSSPPPREVPLPQAPLVRVITQVRFPSILSIEKRDFVAPFQEAIRARYPSLKNEQSRGMIVGPQGPVPTPPTLIWRFADIENKWRVSLAADFVAIETTAYKSRDDLMDRLEQVLLALDEHIGPKMIDRLGVRYIDRITGEAVSKIEDLVRREILGVAGTAAAKHASQTLSEALFLLPSQSAELRARWGLLPSRSTVDPAAIEPIDERSWILDLDMFSSKSRPYDQSEILSDARSYAERSYCFFRWVVTKEFLRIYGGEV